MGLKCQSHQQKKPDAKETFFDKWIPKLDCLPLFNGNFRYLTSIRFAISVTATNCSPSPIEISQIPWRTLKQAR